MSTDPLSATSGNEPADTARGEPAAQAPSLEQIPFQAYRPGPPSVEPAVAPSVMDTQPMQPAPVELPRQIDDSAQPSVPAIPGFPTATAPPGIADNVDHALDARSIPLARIGGFIGVAVLSGLALIPTVIAVLSAPGRWIIAAGLWTALVALLTIRAWIWPRLTYRHTSYRLSSRGLVIRRGVLWRSVAHVPRSRVQHTDVSQGPLERYFELGTLTVHTAGTQFASVSLSGLAHLTAESIRDVLINAGEGDGV